MNYSLKLNQLNQLETNDLISLVRQFYHQSYENQREVSLLNQIYDHLVEAIFLIDLQDEAIVMCNQGAVEMFDFNNKSDFIKRFDLKHHLPITLNNDEQSLEKIIHEGKPCKYEVECTSTKKRYFWGNLSMMPFQLQGQYFQIIRVFDITQHKQESIQKQQQEVYFNTVIENGVDAIWAVDTNLKLTYANSIFRQLFRHHFNNEAKDYKPLFTGQGEDFHRYWRGLYARVLKGEKFNLVYPFREVYFELYFKPIIIQEQICGVSVQAHNITKFNQIQEQLQVQNHKLKQANTELDRFAYQVSHDLRSPLRSIVGILNLLEQEEDKEGQKKYISLLQRSAGNMDNFIQDMLHLSQRQQNKPEVNQIDWQKLIMEVWELRAFSQEAQSVEFKYQVNDNGNVFHSDFKLIKVILGNLVGNALKHGKPSSTSKTPQLEVKVDIEGNASKLWVTDNGTGIPEEYQTKIFEQFYRVNSHCDGSGLGLYIVKELSELIGTTVEIAFSNSYGTCFYLFLPSLKDST